MSDFIEREPVAIFVEECGCSPKWIAKRIRNQEAFPAADVAPVRHGYWEFPIFANSDGELDPRVKCSECGSVEAAFARWKYCPNCGARMDKENEHEA